MTTRSIHSRLMRRLGFTLGPNDYARTYKAVRWTHPSGAVLVLSPEDRPSAAEIVSRTIGSAIEHVLTPLETAVSGPIIRARQRNRL